MSVEFEKVTAEEIGLHSEDVLNFINEIESNHLCLHGFMLMRNGKIGAEGYWKPVTQDEPHRMYSVTKSFVAAAIGVLADEGKISLDDKIIKFFPDLIPEGGVHPYLEETTVRNLLMMSTPYSKSTYNIHMKEWLESYFTSTPDHPAGTVFLYDSCGSYVLGAIVKRVTGKDFNEYLKEKVLLEIGFSKDRKCLEGPDGELWAGSALIITLRELAAFANLLLNGGKANGKQLISEKYVREATSKQIWNRTDGSNFSYNCGYGYQIWITKNNAFYLNGMGGQMAIGFPETGLIFACTADIYGNPQGKNQIYDALWNHIVSKLANPIPVNEVSNKLLEEKCNNLEIPPLEGEAYSPLQESINDKTYILDKNPMEISKVKVHLEKDKGVLYYSTPRGDKELHFGMKKFLESKFPETHYPGDRLGVASNKEYRCVCCGAWAQENMLVIRTNVIDEFVGNMTATLSFRDDVIGVEMHKNAQFFLDEYEGFTGGRLE